MNTRVYNSLNNNNKNLNLNDKRLSTGTIPLSLTGAESPINMGLIGAKTPGSTRVLVKKNNFKPILSKNEMHELSIHPLSKNNPSLNLSRLSTECDP